uniref:Uncharacterized protein n=1 Tax=Timema monikensis TaxID=170555 RepID=A0A7R9EJT4_9NEOP|nr:unnamed protein product [Timema monikensis]
MLPADDSTLVASAVENGQTVVLTEAGKLALNLTQENIQNLVQNSVPITSPKTTAIPVNKRKVITIRASQLYSMDGQKAPNILKRVDGNRNLSGTFPSNVMLTSARTVSSPALLRNNSKAESAMDMWSYQNHSHRQLGVYVAACTIL